MMMKFQSRATQDLLMLPKHAHDVLALIGKSEQGPGILEPKDMPAALAVLKGLPQEPLRRPEATSVATEAEHHRAQDEDGEHMPEPPEPDFIDEPISLRKRAWPLVTMIERALKEDKPIVWNVTI